MVDAHAKEDRSVARRPDQRRGRNEGLDDYAAQHSRDMLA